MSLGLTLMTLYEVARITLPTAIAAMSGRVDQDEYDR